MKKIFFLPIFALLVFSSCTSLDDTEIPKIFKKIFSDDFQDLPHNVTFVKENWINFAEAGTVLWKSRIFDGNAYAEFNTFQSGNVSNIGWLVTPEIDTQNNRNVSLIFQSAQNFVSSDDNNLKIYISNNLTGNNVLAATWTELSATVANRTTAGYTFISSGKVDLSAHTGGKIRIAFKVTGSGTNTSLDGLFQVDNVKIIEN